MTGRTPIVSVITANFDGAPYVGEAVRSVLGQTLTDLELIVVDDGSADDSLAVIREAAAGDPRVKLLAQVRNRGPGAARNRALDAARGRWIAVFDSDDLMAPERLQVLVGRGEADGAEIVADDLTLFSDDRPQGRPFLGAGWDAPRWLDASDLVRSARLYGRGPDLGFLKPMFRAEALEGMRYRTDTRIGEDYDLLLRLLLAGRRMRLEPRALYRYRKHGASISHRLSPEHVRRMIEADQALAPAFAGQPARVRRLQAARMRSLERALVYERVVARLKARELAPALAESVVRPDVWPLLTLPVRARLQRLAERIGPQRTALA
jgi:succinoglycan biosynthesis protein ExoO